MNFRISMLLKCKSNDCELVVSDSGRFHAFVSVEKPEGIDNYFNNDTGLNSVVVDHDSEDEFYTRQSYQYGNNRYLNGIFWLLNLKQLYNLFFRI